MTSTSTTFTNIPDPSTYGQQVTFEVTVASVGEPPTGQVDFNSNIYGLIGTAILSPSGTGTLLFSNLSVNTHDITATYIPDSGSFSESDMTNSHTVNKADTEIVSLVCNPDPATDMEAVTIVATVQAVSPGPGPLPPAGIINFNETPDNTSGSIPIDGSGDASVDLGPFPTVGTHTIKAIYAGDSNYNASPVMTKELIVTCILPGAKIQIPSGHELIENIKSGDLVIDEYGNSVKVINNIRFGMGLKDVVTIRKGSLGNDLPFEDLEITHGHPVKIPESTNIISNNGFSKNEQVVQNLVNGESITTENRGITCSYCLMTEPRTHIMTNGIPVATWGQKDFQEFCELMSKQGCSILHKLQ